MPMHLAGFLEDIDPAAAFARITALEDDALFTQGDDIRVPVLNNIIWAAAGLDDAVAARARLESPSLMATSRHEISPVNSATGDVEPGSPPAIQKMINNPVVLGVDEILNCEINSNPGAAADQWVLVCFADGPVQPVTGQRIYTVRATSATTLTARAWTSCTLTLDETLPGGDYGVVGLRAQGASIIAARVVFRGTSTWRPGVIGCDLEADLNDDIFRGGNLGIWGEFPFTQTPAIEVLADLADTAQIFHLDLVRLR
tara:strand:- start:8400 stop:9170 length:771 start_codon:yes stop_codon:yes gene_type:complete